MSYVVFDRPKHTRRRHDGGAPLLAITPQGRLELNAAAKELFGALPRARLWFDAETRRLAIEPTPAGAEHSYAVVRFKSMAAVSAYAFLRQYGLGSPERRRFPVVRDAARGWLEVSLEEPAGSAGS